MDLKNTRRRTGICDNVANIVYLARAQSFSIDPENNPIEVEGIRSPAIASTSFGGIARFSRILV